MPETAVSLDDALSAYDKQSDQPLVRQAEQQRQEVVKRFPLDAWPTLPLDRYALGLGKKEDSFCWWMEFGASHAGSMGGGAAQKHLIFRWKNGTWWFDKNAYSNETAAWEAIRAGFVEAFGAAERGDWRAVEAIESINSGAMLRVKALYVYFPNDLIPITSPPHLRHYLGLLGKDDGALKEKDVIDLNRTLLETLRARADLRGWTPKEIERFLYHWADPRDRQRALKIAPGEDARLWDECLQAGYIRVGWGKVGDLREFDSKEAFRAKFEDVYGAAYKGHQSTISRTSKDVWTLCELEPGDLVIANKGTAHVLAVGVVTNDGYEWTPHEGDDFNHIVHVKWDKSYEQDLPPQRSWRVTIARVPQALLSHIMAKKGVTKGGRGAGDGPSIKQPMPVDPVFREISSALERKGQAVLYGPPGTGKTYYARRFAVWWLVRQTDVSRADLLLADDTAFAEAERRLSTARVGRRVWWIVANPREWSWDRVFKEKRVDYRYGKLRRNYPLVRVGDLALGYQSTPEKRIVALARVSRELHTDGNGEKRITLEPVARIDNGLNYDELQKDSILDQSEPMRCNNQGTLFSLTEDEFDHLSGLLTERDPDLRKWFEDAPDTGTLTRLTFHPSYSYEDFVEGFRPVDTGSAGLSVRLEDGIFKRVCREAQANLNKPYLVLIDEINRANVAKVFGELITLLEKDKRGMLVSLPQSKEPFTIPPNVYVLGTMNTADRSIKLLDAALRRRFAFLELMPDSSLLRGGMIGDLALDDFLDELNRRVAAKEGREKQIGHSFLMEGANAISEAEEFGCRFRQDILPLLQEYCYEDYRLLADYIGDKIVDKDAGTLNKELLYDDDRLIEALAKTFEDTSGGQ
jgi:5-methylcytosine-specific restriction enzyme B